MNYSIEPDQKLKYTQSQESASSSSSISMIAIHRNSFPLRYIKCQFCFAQFKGMSALRLYQGNKIIFFIRYLHVKSSLSCKLYFLMKFLCPINFFGSIKLYHKIHWNIFSCFSRRFCKRLSDRKKFLSPRNPTWIPFTWYDKNIVLRDLRNTPNSLAVSASQ